MCITFLSVPTSLIVLLIRRRKSLHGVQDSHLPKHYALLETNLVKSGKPFLGGDKPNAADVAFFAVNNIYAKANIDTDKVLSDVAPTLQKALAETTK